MSLLLDTNVISRAAPKGGAAAAVSMAFAEWLRKNNAEIHLSSVTIAEISAGISALERNGATARAKLLASWLEAVIALHTNRILPLDIAVAIETGMLLDKAIGAGTDPGFEDAAIAATASIHRLTVVTANTRHFSAFGVAFFEPPA